MIFSYVGQAAIEGLSSAGAVTVTTASVTNSIAFGGKTGDVLEGSPYVTPSADLSGVISVGDWVRLCDATDGLVSCTVGVAYQYFGVLVGPCSIQVAKADHHRYH